jgi:hypothetical protein
MERPLFLLLSGLLLSVPVIVAILAIRRVDLPIFLLFLHWGPLVMWFKELSSGLWGLDADVSDCQQIDHHFGLLHGDLFDSPNIADPVTKGVDDFDVLDIRDNISGVAEMFYVLPETFIKLLLDCLQGFSTWGSLVRVLKVPNEYGT